MKQVGLLLLFCVLFNQLFSQEYLRMIDEGTHRVSDIIESAEFYFKDRDQGRGTGYKQFKRWEYMATRLQDENGFLPSHEHYLRELARFEAMQNEYKGPRSEDSGFWSDMGPDYWNATSGWNPGVGRITTFSIHPNNEDYMIIGAETGGIWRTEDGGNHWLPLTDYFSNMRVYSCAIDPIDPKNYYFGSNNGRIYKSVDSGATWQQIGSAGNSLVNQILIHPLDNDLLFASVQNSGLYRSDNGGASWIQIVNDPNGFDFEFKPGDPDVIYASGSSFHKSTDRGLTFTSIAVKHLLDIESPVDLQGNYYVEENNFTSGRVPVPAHPNGIRAEMALYRDISGGGNLACESPSNPNELQGKIVVVLRGECTFVSKVVRAQEAGALAVIVVNNVSGNITMGGEDSRITIPAVSVSPELGNVLIDRLANGETISCLLEKSTTNRLGTGAKMMGVSPDNPDLVYLLEADNSIFGGFYKSTDGGETFEKLDHGNRNYFGYDTRAQDDRGQAPRDMAIAVNPFDANEVHIAGILSWVSFDGGVSFTATSDWIPSSAASKQIGYCHADVDFLAFYGSNLYALTDGGIFRAANTKNVNSDYYEDLTEGLGIRQFYKIGVSQTNPAQISGGSQDNGTSAFSEFDGWIDWLGADGMETFYDKNNSNKIYGTSQNGSMYVSYNGGLSYSTLPRPGSGRGNWVTPFEQDPIVDNTIYVAYEQVFRSTDGGWSWEAISQEFPGRLHHLKIAPSNNQIIYAAYNAGLYRTITGGGSWSLVRTFSGNINEIAIHPSDPNKIAVALSGNEKVSVSENGGSAWTSFGFNLPNFSALSLVWEDNGKDGLYLGMNYGIYYTDNTIQEWIPFNNNLPNVIVNELEINYADGRLYAGTYGRGLWSSPLFGGITSSRLQELDSALSFYPNPAQYEVFLNWEGQSNKTMAVRIFDSMGKVVSYKREVPAFNGRLDVSGLLPGVYYVRINTDAGATTKKLVIR